MLQFGADPEFFFTVSQDGKDYVVSPAMLNRFSGLKFIGGDTKHPVFFDSEEFLLMMDGVAAEVTIKKPQPDGKSIHRIMQNTFNSLQEIASKLSFNGMKISAVRKPVVDIIPDWYTPHLDDEQIYQGFIYGCDPDEDADDFKYKCVTTDASKDLFRYGGGHHHISGEPMFFDFIRPAILLSSIFVGTFCVARSPYPELEVQRGMVYGRPARYRPQPSYGGMEYRTPSNSWTGFSPEVVEEMYNKYYTVQKLMYDESKAIEVLNNFKNRAFMAIVEGDQKLCMEIEKELEGI